MNRNSVSPPALACIESLMAPPQGGRPRPGVRQVGSRQLRDLRYGGVEQFCQVIEEDALTVDVAEVGTYTLMWTPTDPVDTSGAGFISAEGVLGEGLGSGALALATGFLFTEGIIQGLDDVAAMAFCPQIPGVVRVQLKDPQAVVTRRRNVVMTSSCGICGSREVVENNTFGLQPVPDRMRLDAGGFSRLMTEMKARQAIFAETGGAHAAAIFSADGMIHGVAEDLGRHNTLDKVIGATLLGSGSFSGCGVLLSSRVSLEMVTKAVRAGLEVVAAVSAPTSLAIEVAEGFGLTLCAFVRGERCTVFTHPHRITQAADSGPVQIARKEK